MTSRVHVHRFFRSLAAVAGLAALALAAPAGSQESESVVIPGTSVTVTPPPGFTVARGTKGLDNGAGSSITFGETSAAAYAELAERFRSAKNLSAGYAAQKVTIRGVRQIDTPNGPVPFATGSQSSNGTDIVKYLALLKGDKTVIVTFNVANRSLSEADAETLLRSISLTPAPTLEEQLAKLPFRFEAVEPFRVTRVIGRDTVILAAVAGDDESSKEPEIVIGRGQSQAMMGDEARVAVELLTNTGGFREAVITAQAAAPFAGGGGYVISAVVEDRTVVQYLRIVPGGAYLRFLARGETSAMQAAEAAITAIAESVEQN
jgi:hypothetical protein